MAIVGCGALGSWTAAGLACAGVGRLVLVDDDTVELSNLNRQLLFRRADVGRRKVDAAADALTAFNPGLEVERVHTRIASAADVERLARGADLVVGTADHPPLQIARWLNAGCTAAGVPHVTAAQFGSMVRLGPLYRPGITGCHACEEQAARDAYPDYDALVAYRAERKIVAATMGPPSGLVGSVLSMDALHLITGAATPSTQGRALVVDMRDLSTTAEELVRREDCEVCGRRLGGLGALGRPLRLGEVAHRHALGRRDLGRVAQVPLGVERGLAARARGGDRLAVRVVDEVAGGEDAGLLGARRAALDDDVALVVGVDLAARRSPTAARGRSR